MKENNCHSEPRSTVRSIDWQIAGMYLLLLLSLFGLIFTSRKSYLREILPKGICLVLRFVSIVGTIGVPAFLLGEKLPREWFHPDVFPFKTYAWEKSGKIYEKLGIKWWKNHMPDMSKYIKSAFAKQGNLSRNPSHLHRLVQETCSAEFVHWVLIFFSLAFAILMDEGGILAMILYVVGNLPSIIIQRYNRPRIQKLIQRIERCANS